MKERHANERERTSVGTLLAGEMLVMTGAGYENETEFDEMPPTVTDTVTEAPSPAGIVQMICVKQ